MVRMSDIIDEVYGVDSKPLRQIVFGVGNDEDGDGEQAGDEEDDDSGSMVLSYTSLAAQTVVSLCRTSAGRWNESVFRRDVPHVPDNVFEPLPNVPPAAWKPEEVSGADAGDESKLFTSDGILVDDIDNPCDIALKASYVLENTWLQESEAIESQLCEVLGVKELRDYFRKPGKGGFWDDHVSRYSKSRRKAPIYWLLQSSKKNYALWLYYHRLDKDLLFKALVNYVEPKIRLEVSRLETLRSPEGRRGRIGQGGQAARQGSRKAGRLPVRTAGLRGQAAPGGEPAPRTRPQRWRRPEHRPAPRTRPVEGGQELLGRTPRRQIRVVVHRQAASAEGIGKIESLEGRT